MPSFLVSPHMSPVSKYTITKEKGTFSRIVLSFSGHKQTVFGEIIAANDSNVDVIIYNSPSSNPVQLGRRFIVSIESGFQIYIETTIHKNGHVSNSFPESHVPHSDGHKRTRYGAVPGDVTLKAMFPNSSGGEFEKFVQIIKPVVLII